MVQRELPVHGFIKQEVRDLPWDLIAKCSTEQAAMRVCVSQSKIPYTHDEIAEYLDCKRCEVTAMLNADKNRRKKWMCRTRQVRLQQLCGNRAIDQWAEMFAKGMLICQRSVDEQLEKLEKE